MCRRRMARGRERAKAKSAVSLMGLGMEEYDEPRARAAPARLVEGCDSIESAMICAFAFGCETYGA